MWIFLLIVHELLLCNIEDERQRWDTQTSGKEKVPRWNGRMPAADAVKQFSGQWARRCGGTSSAIIVVKLCCGPMKMESLHDFMPRPDFFFARQRISYNTRYFSGNYGVVIAILAVYALYVREEAQTVS